MKNNIKEELQTKIIREKLLNDNALLQLIKDESREKQCFARVRYIEKAGTRNTIGETEIGPINIYGFFLNGEEDTVCYIGADENQVIEYNTLGLAYYTKTDLLKEDSLILEKVYDLNLHEFIPTDYMEPAYRRLFNKSSKTKIYINDF